MTVPKLRFKEFDNDYLELKYDKFAPLQRGFDLPVSTIVEGDFPVVFSNGILKKHNEFKAKAPGVVTGRSGTIGNITWVEKDYWPHNTSLWVTNFFGNEPKYVFYFLQEFDVSRFASGSGVPTLNRNDVHAQLINIPDNKEEQTKIAAFLSTVDEKISQLNQKHQLLSQYKQGMMQKLFSQQIRFKADDGSEFGDWDKKKLVELTSWSSGGTPSKDYGGYWNGDIPLISGASMHTQKLFESDVTITELGLKKGSKLAPKDSILILVRGSMLFKKIPIGLTFKDVAFNQDVKCIQPNNNLDSAYLFQWLLAKEHTIQNKVTSTGIGAGKLDTADLQNLEFLQPTLEEQTKIANFLSNIDQKIEVVAQQIEQAKTWKKGLLQQMFV